MTAISASYLNGIVRFQYTCSGTADAAIRCHLFPGWINNPFAFALCGPRKPSITPRFGYSNGAYDPLDGRNDGEMNDKKRRTIIVYGVFV
jgi:hypothetical protein